MFVSFGDQMIGKWVVWMHFFVLWALIYPQLRMETVCDGSWRRMRIDIRLFYNKLRGPVPIIFSWKNVWKVKASRRISFFVWTAVWDKILIGDNLRGRGMVFIDWCIMCRCNGETMYHLLLHCGKAYRLWSLVFRSFGIFWVLPRLVVDTLFGWWDCLVFGI